VQPLLKFAPNLHQKKANLHQMVYVF